MVSVSARRKPRLVGEPGDDARRADVRERGQSVTWREPRRGTGGEAFWEEQELSALRPGDRMFAVAVVRWFAHRQR